MKILRSRCGHCFGQLGGILGKGTVVTVGLPLKNGGDPNAENINSR
jgi:hypothetical protein